MPLPFALIPAALSAFQGGLNLVQGIQQRRQGDRMNVKRPKYYIPGQIGANTRMYGDLANTTTLPGQARAENNIRANTSNMINAITQTGGGTNNILAAISGINQNENQAMNQIAQSAAELNLANKDKFAESNEVLAGYKDREFDYNQNQPYMMALSRKMALQQAGAENINNALTSLGNLGTAFIGADLSSDKQAQPPVTNTYLPYSGNSVPGLRKYNQNFRIYK